MMNVLKVLFANVTDAITFGSLEKAPTSELGAIRANGIEQFVSRTRIRPYQYMSASGCAKRSISFRQFTSAVELDHLLLHVTQRPQQSKLGLLRFDELVLELRSKLSDFPWTNSALFAALKNISDLARDFCPSAHHIDDRIRTLKNCIKVHWGASGSRTYAERLPA